MECRYPGQPHQQGGSRYCSRIGQRIDSSESRDSSPFVITFVRASWFRARYACSPLFYMRACWSSDRVKGWFLLSIVSYSPPRNRVSQQPIENIPKISKLWLEERRLILFVLIDYHHLLPAKYSRICLFENSRILGCFGPDLGNLDHFLWNCPEKLVKRVLWARNSGRCFQLRHRYLSIQLRPLRNVVCNNHQLALYLHPPRNVLLHLQL